MERPFRFAEVLDDLNDLDPDDLTDYDIVEQLLLRLVDRYNRLRQGRSIPGLMAYGRFRTWLLPPAGQSAVTLFGAMRRAAGEPVEGIRYVAAEDSDEEDGNVPEGPGNAPEGQDDAGGVPDGDDELAGGGGEGRGDDEVGGEGQGGDGAEEGRAGDSDTTVELDTGSEGSDPNDSDKDVERAMNRMAL